MRSFLYGELVDLQIRWRRRLIVELTYPSKGFLRKAQIAVRNGQEIRIIISAGWRKKILLQHIDTLLEIFEDSISCEGREEKKWSWKFMRNMFLIGRLFNTCLYAKTGGYKASFIKEGILILSK